MKIGQFHRDMLSTFTICVITCIQQIGKEKQFKYHKKEKKFEEYNYPQRLSQRHLSETVVVEIKNFLPKGLSSYFLRSHIAKMLLRKYK